jgi:hypothetical protein
MPDDTDPDDPIADLRERIRATQEAAERLAGEAAGARREWDAGRVPPAGWASAREHGERTDEVQALASLLRTLRDLVPADLEAQVREVLRQVLLLVRALIDWWVERIDGAPAPAKRGGGQAAVVDLPVD